MNVPFLSYIDLSSIFCLPPYLSHLRSLSGCSIVLPGLFLSERTDEYLPFYVVSNMFLICRTLLLKLLLPHIPYLSHLCLFILQHLFIFLLFNSFISLSTIIFPICRLLLLFSIFSYHLISSLFVACPAVFLQKSPLY